MFSFNNQELYPKTISIDGKNYEFEKILKEDFFSVNILYKSKVNNRYVLKISDFRFIFGFILRPLAAYFSKREYTIYKALNDLKYIPDVGPRYGKRGFFHTYIEGKTLHELSGLDILPDNFFDCLKDIIDELHRRRIFYLDLNKLGNIIVGHDMMPYLIDFQISIPFGSTSSTGSMADRIKNKIFFTLIKEDLYHVYKHKKRFQPFLMTEPELEAAKRTTFNRWYNRLFGHPYRKVKRLIYPKGSNEVIWYKWKKVKGKNSTMP